LVTHFKNTNFCIHLITLYYNILKTKLCPTECGPFDIKNGFISSTQPGTKFGDEINIDCKTGYTLLGDSKITCGASGNWSDYPICQIKGKHNANVSTLSLLQQSNYNNNNNNRKSLGFF